MANGISGILRTVDYNGYTINMHSNAENKYFIRVLLGANLIKIQADEIFFDDNDIEYNGVIELAKKDIDNL